MNPNDQQETKASNCPDSCPPGKTAGPVREAGGATGAGNLSEGEADRTGGATGGVGEKPRERIEKFRPPPSA